MPVPNVYRSGGGPLTNFDFFDIIGGTALQTLYVGDTVQDTTTTYVLNTNTFYSQDIELSTNIPKSTASYTKLTDIDCDISVGMPRIMSGTGIINVNSDLYGASTNTGHFYIVWRIRKFSAASVETEIASAQTSTVNTTNAVHVKQLFSTSIVIPKTSFSPGDKIRLTIEVWGKNTDAGDDATCILGIDPNNRTGTVLGASQTTQLKAFLPFLVEL